MPRCGDRVATEWGGRRCSLSMWTDPHDGRSEHKQGTELWVRHAKKRNRGKLKIEDKNGVNVVAPPLL